MPRRQVATVIPTCPQCLVSVRESIAEEDLMPCGITISTSQVLIPWEQHPVSGD